jgi:hypothetical protein
MPKLLPKHHQLVLLPGQLLLRVLKLICEVPILIEELLVMLQGLQEGRLLLGHLR